MNFATLKIVALFALALSLGCKAHRQGKSSVRGSEISSADPAILEIDVLARKIIASTDKRLSGIGQKPSGIVPQIALNETPSGMEKTSYDYLLLFLDLYNQLERIQHSKGVAPTALSAEEEEKEILKAQVDELTRKLGDVTVVIEENGEQTTLSSQDIKELKLKISTLQAQQDALAKENKELTILAKSVPETVKIASEATMAVSVVVTHYTNRDINMWVYGDNEGDPGRVLKANTKVRIFATKLGKNSWVHFSTEDGRKWEALAGSFQLIGSEASDPQSIGTLPPPSTKDETKWWLIAVKANSETMRNILRLQFQTHLIQERTLGGYPGIVRCMLYDLAEAGSRLLACEGNRDVGAFVETYRLTHPDISGATPLHQQPDPRYLKE